MSDEYIPIKTHFDVQSGFAFPSTSFVESGIPIVRMSDLKAGKLKFESAKYVSRSWLYTASPFILKRGDFLLGMSGSLSNYAVVTEDDEPALLNQRVGRLKQRDKNADYEYVCYWLKSTTYARYADIQGEGAAQKNISSKQIGQFQYRDISPEKQKEISLRLNSIEFAIEKTGALILKYHQIKAGLMHDLFTRGVTADGKLRPTREQAPELYQETHIGWIPKEWDWKCCEDICERICVGIVIRPADYYVSDGIPSFRSANIREAGINTDNFVYISERANQLLFKSQVRKGDILTVRTGYPGTSAVVPDEFDSCNCVDILITTPSDVIDSTFLCYWINSPSGKEQVLRKQGGLAQQHFNVGEMKKLISVIPDEKEQRRIVERLNCISSRIAGEEDLLNKYELKKQGLMHDLLTGKVSVKIDQAETAHV